MGWEGTSAFKQPLLKDSQMLSMAYWEHGESRSISVKGSSSLADIESDGQEIAIEMCNSWGRRARRADPQGEQPPRNSWEQKGKAGMLGQGTGCRRSPAFPGAGGLDCGHLRATANLPVPVSHKRVTKSHPVLWWHWTNPKMSSASRGQQSPLGD